MSCKHARPYQTKLSASPASVIYLEICRTCGAGRKCTITAAGAVEYGEWSPPAKVELGQRKVGQGFVLSISADGSVASANTLRHGKGTKGDPPVWVTGRRITLAEIPISVLAQLPAAATQPR